MLSDQMKMMLSELVEAEGPQGAVSALADAIADYADEMSDLGLKESAIAAAEAVDRLRNIKRLFLVVDDIMG